MPRKYRLFTASAEGKLAKQAGFSVIEVLAAMCIVAILTSTAVPNLKSMLSKSAVKSKSILLNASLKLARNYAISSGSEVHLCALARTGEQRCAEKRNYNASWSKGWMVFADVNQNYEYDEQDYLLQIVSDQTPAKVVFNQRGLLRFMSNGTARSAGFYICNAKADEIRHIQLLHTGRTRKLAYLSEKRRNICAQS